MTNQAATQDAVFNIALSPDFTQDGIAFAARASGLYRSQDSGSTWHFALASLDLSETLATIVVAIAPSFAEDKTVFAGVSGGILRSMDAGDTWHITALPTPPPFVSTLVISPDFRRDGTAFAGTLEDGIFCTRDRGVSWLPCTFGLMDLNVMTLAISPDFAHDETIFAGTESGIFASRNGGRAWREVDFSMDYAPVISLTLSPGYQSDGTVYAGTEANGLFRSVDQGRTWSRIASDSIKADVNALVLPTDYPTRTDLLAMLNDRVMLSRDNGQTWTTWETEIDLTAGLTSIVAPNGLDANAPMWLSLMDGQIVRSQLST